MKWVIDAQEDMPAAKSEDGRGSIQLGESRMKKPVVVTFVTCDEGDWEGIYADGQLFAQGHSVTTRDFLELIAECKYFKGETLEINLSDEQMEELGNQLPNDLSSVLEYTDAK